MMTEEQKQAFNNLRKTLVACNRLNYCESAITELEAALTQPSGPAYFINRIEFTDAYGPDVELRVYDSELDALKSKEDHGGDVIPVYLNAPHTAPIEPICATGGAEWVKVSERMPRSNETVQFYVADDKAIKQGRFIRDSWHQEQDWCESSYGGMIDSEVCGNITHWMPLPAAPKP